MSFLDVHAASRSFFSRPEGLHELREAGDSHPAGVWTDHRTRVDSTPMVKLLCSSCTVRGIYRVHGIDWDRLPRGIYMHVSTAPGAILQVKTC